MKERKDKKHVREFGNWSQDKYFFTCLNECSRASGISKMNIETLKKYDKKKIMKLTTFIIFAFIIILFSVSLAKYRSSKSINIAKGTINYKQPDLNLVSVYLEDSDNIYKQASDGKIPTSGYTLNEDINKTRCTIKGEVDNNIKVTYENGEVNFSKLTTAGTKCYLYFDKIKGISADEIISSGIATDDSMFAGISGDGVYIWDKGDYSGGTETIKYYRGNVNNNWVVFGKDGTNYIWWRIIRNNSNGSIRMIYAGLSSSKTNAPITTGTGTQIGTKVFNTSYNDNIYVGLKYTSNQVHGNETSSTILGTEDSTDKTTLYGWYNATLKTSSECSSKIDLDAGFCNDRTPISGTGLGTTSSDYAALERLNTNKAPSLLCTNTDDIFKTPVGLITADEVSMGGIGDSSKLKNTNSYLYTNNNYWTISPYDFHGGFYGHAYVYFIDSSGRLNGDDSGGVLNTNTARGVRPVINLKADTLFEEGGNGTSTSPYIVIGT